MVDRLTWVYIFFRLLSKSIVTSFLVNHRWITSIVTLIGESVHQKLSGGLVIDQVSAYTVWMLFGLVISAYD